MEDSRKIVIIIGSLAVQAELNDTKTAGMIYDVLPIESRGDFWGDEIYFKIPVDTDQENPQETVDIGDLAYWPTGNAFCIFFGRTPVSMGDEIRPASEVTVVGRVKGDSTVFRNALLSNPVRIERA